MRYLVEIQIPDSHKDHEQYKDSIFIQHLKEIIENSNYDLPIKAKIERMEENSVGEREIENKFET